MEKNDLLLDLIRRFEGLRLAAYLCPAGVPTIGYGHTGPEVTLGMPKISADQAEEMLAEDADFFLRESARVSPGLLTAGQARRAAIADFCFNLGVGRYQKSTLKHCVDLGDWQAAARELHKWVWGGGKVLPGLVTRRKAEALLLSQAT